MPPGRKIFIIDWALAFAPADSAWSLKDFPSVRPMLPTRPTNRNSRRFGRHMCSGLPQNELVQAFMQKFCFYLVVCILAQVSCKAQTKFWGGEGITLSTELATEAPKPHVAWQNPKNRMPKSERNLKSE